MRLARCPVARRAPPSQQIYTATVLSALLCSLCAAGWSMAYTCTGDEEGSERVENGMQYLSAWVDTGIGSRGINNLGPLVLEVPTVAALTAIGWWGEAVKGGIK